MTESMKDYEKELEASMKTIEEGDILIGSVISVDEKEVILDLKYYAEGVIPAEYFSREPGFSLKENVQEGDEISATVIRKDDGNTAGQHTCAWLAFDFQYIDCRADHFLYLERISERNCAYCMWH